jgi:hydrogenase/urease accessory protein HupE
VKSALVCGVLALLAALWLSLACPRTAWSHELDSASLSLVEVAPGRFSVRFHASSEALQKQLAAPASFPRACQLHDALLDCGPSGLVGSIELPWLPGTLTRVIVEVQWQDGKRLLRVVTPSSPRLTVYGIPAGTGLRGLAPIVADYVRLGIEHILTGFDHLLFVIALTLLVQSRAALLATITAFTLAHSLTLSATALGLASLAMPPVEATIAFSVVLVCAECLKARDSLTRRAPWLVAFGFGLLHGFGFASALLAIGLPEDHLFTALGSFNIGVELAQLALVLGVVALERVASRLKWESDALRRGVVYAMGGVAAFWFVERLPAVLGG